MENIRYPKNKPYRITFVEGKKHAIFFKEEQLGLGIFDSKIALAMEKALNDAYRRGFDDGIKIRI